MKLGIYLNAQHPAGDDPARRFAMLKDGARASRKAKSDDLGDFAAGRREAAALGWWHMSVLGQARRRSAAGRSA